MRKRICFLLAFVLAASNVLSQEIFTVIKVNGNIVIERTGNSLGIGTSFLQTENLLFKIPESRAAVINPRIGRYLITADNVSEFKNAKSNYLPASNKISTRSVISAAGEKELSDQFGSTYPVLNEIKVLIDTVSFPLNKNRYFYITYDLNNRTVNKKLSFRSDTIYIRKSELLTVDGQLLKDPSIDLMKLVYYREGPAYSSIPVTSFTPVFPDIDSLKREMKIILDNIEMNPYDDKFNTIKSFLNDFYGDIGVTSLKLWLRDNTGLTE